MAKGKEKGRLMNRRIGKSGRKKVGRMSSG